MTKTTTICDVTGKECTQKFRAVFQIEGEGLLDLDLSAEGVGQLLGTLLDAVPEHAMVAVFERLLGPRWRSSLKPVAKVGETTDKG